MKGKLLIIFGTRPEAIKMAPLALILQSYFGDQVRICVTAQHRQMLDQVLDFFDIKPDYDLNLMAPNQTLNGLSGRLFGAIDGVYEAFQPDLVFLHGDTTTSSICAWAAFHRKIQVAHIEAGLRTYDKNAPFPEEINRQITGRIADIHFAPTLKAKENLIQEGVADSEIIVTGNTVIDALHLGLVKLDLGYSNSEIEQLKVIFKPKTKIILVTGHRRENFGDGFVQVCEALLEISKSQNVQIIYPVHLNPEVQNPVYSLLGNVQNIQLIAPLGYAAFLWLMKQSYMILTDSGGIQEEAPSLGKPVLVMREVTERPEAVSAGVVKLVGTNKHKIIEESRRLLSDNAYYEKMSSVINPYGDGKACERIVQFLQSAY